MKKGKKGKKVAPAPLKKKEPKKPPQNPLFEKRPRNFGIGNTFDVLIDVHNSAWLLAVLIM